MLNRLTILVAFAFLPLLPSSLHAQNPVGSTEAPVAAVSNSGSALTPEVMSKMEQLIASKGRDKELDAAFASALGLTATGQKWQERQIATRSSSSNLVHGFAISRGGDQDVVLYIRRPKAIYIFRAHRDGKVVTALVCDNQTGQITMRGPAEAQGELGVELAMWASNVDDLISGK